MNANHADLCRSPEWAAYLQQEILTPLMDGVDPARMLVWLQAAGFHPVSLTVSDRLSFAATKPSPAA